MIYCGNKYDNWAIIIHSAEKMVVSKYEISHDDLEKSLVKYSNRQEIMEVYGRLQVCMKIIVNTWLFSWYRM